MKKRYWMISMLTIVLMAAFLLPACVEPEPTPAPAPAPAAKTIKISYTCPPGKSYSGGLEYLAEEFPKQTNGRYVGETYPANTLVTLPAAIDVTETEPIPPDDPLLTLSNLIIAPHIGSSSFPTRTKMAIMAAENLLAGLHGEMPPNCINPEALQR